MSYRIQFTRGASSKKFRKATWREPFPAPVSGCGKTAKRLPSGSEIEVLPGGSPQDVHFGYARVIIGKAWRGEISCLRSTALRGFQRQYLVLDNDDAGLEATLTLLHELGSTAIRVALPDGIKDPSQLAARSDGRELFAAALLQAVGQPVQDNPIR